MKSFNIAYKIFSNNIAVDPTFKCHAERSRSIYFKRGLRSFTSVQDDKFAKKNELRVNIYIIAKYFTQNVILSVAKYLGFREF